MTYNGIILINKPEKFTSFDVIAKMRGILKMKKLGHGGTLDPMATGVLPVFVGNATKACDMLPMSDKTYKASFRLGITTDTQDIWGKTIKTTPYKKISREKLEAVLEHFRGNIMQMPPMYSAVSVNGKRLYDLARRGIEVEREKKSVNIYELTLSLYDEEKGEGELIISCSKGTYIRTLINDIGDELHSGGIMTALTRLKAAGFTLSECITMEELEKAENKEQFIIPTEKLYKELAQVHLNSVQEKMYRNGIRLDINKIIMPEITSEIAVFGSEFLGLATVNEKDELVIKKNFYIR